MPFLAQLMPPRAQTVPFVAAFFRSFFDQSKPKNPALISDFAAENSKQPNQTRRARQWF